MKDLEFHVSREGSTETLKVLKSFAIKAESHGPIR
jgi:hypothetical protein